MSRIFLSYARKDDEEFVESLFDFLSNEGFEVWWDRRSMPSRALTFMQEIRNAIDESERVVVVLGPRARNSVYVAAEWQHALAQGKIVVPVLRSGTHEETPPELRGLHCPDLGPKRERDDANAELLRVLRDPVPALGPLFGEIPGQPPHFQPRTEALRRIAEAVLIDIRAVDIEPNDRVTVVHGMGGVGKSVLTASFGRSFSTRRAFIDGVLWLHAGEQAQPLAMLRTAGTLLGDHLEKYPDLSTATTRLRDRLAKRKYLVVLDDVWHAEQARPFTRVTDARTRVLITTRISGLVSATGGQGVSLDELPEDEALRHLADWVEIDVEELPKQASTLARACGYLPLALALNGAMLRDEVTWDQLLTALSEAELDFAEQAFLDYEHENVYRAIQVSMDVLARADAELHSRYQELVAFLTLAIPEAAIARLWEHTGRLRPHRVSRVLRDLERRSLLRREGPLSRRRIRLHALHRDFLRATCGDVGKAQRALLAAYRSGGPDGWPMVPADGYFHQNLVTHLEQLGELDEIHALLASETPDGANAWFEANTAAGNLSGYLADVERAWRVEMPKDLDDRPQIERGLSRRLGYGAILTSINGLSTKTPSELREACLREGLIEPEQALAEAFLIPQPGPRVEAVLSLLPHLEADLRRRALDRVLSVVRSFRSESARAWKLAGIAAHLESVEREAVVEEALAAAMGAHDDPLDRSSALTGVLQVAPEQERSGLVEDAIAAYHEAVTMAQANEYFVGPVAPLARHADERQRAKLGAIVDLRPGSMEEAWVAMLPAYVLSATEAHDECAENFKDLLESAIALPEGRAIHFFEVGADLYPKSLPPLFIALSEAGYRLDPEVVSEALEEAGCYGDEEQILIEVAALPAYEEDKRPAVVDRLLDELRVLPDEKQRRKGYAALAPHLGPGRILEFMADSRRIGDLVDVVGGLIELIPFVSGEIRSRIGELARRVAGGKEHLEILVRLATVLPEIEREAMVETGLDALEHRSANVGGKSSFVDDQGAALLKLCELASPEQEARALAFAKKWLAQAAGPFAARMLIALSPKYDPREAEEQAADIISGAFLEEYQRSGRIDHPALAGRFGGRPVHNTPRTIEPLLPLLPPEATPWLMEQCEDVRVPPTEMACTLIVSDRLDLPEREEAIALWFERHSYLPLDRVVRHESSLDALLALADRLDDEERRAEVLNTTLTSARALGPRDRTEGLWTIATRFPPPMEEELLREAAATAHPWQVASLGRVLEPREGPGIRRRALLELLGPPPSALARIGRHRESIVELAAAISEDSPEERWRTLEEAHAKLVSRSRGEYTACATAFTSLIESLAGSGPLEELAQSLLNVSHWWP